MEEDDGNVDGSQGRVQGADGKVVDSQGEYREEKNSQKVEPTCDTIKAGTNNGSHVLDGEGSSNSSWKALFTI